MNSHQAGIRLDDPERTHAWLQSLGIVDTPRAFHNLEAIARTGLSSDLFVVLVDRLTEHLPSSSDPDLALNTLERFVANSRNPLALGSLFERDPQALPTLLQLFATSRFLGDVLVNDPEAFELLRITEGRPVAADQLTAELKAEICSLNDRRSILSALRYHKRRETLRIAYGDICRHQRLNVVTQQISYLADALCEAALASARQQLQPRFGSPRRADGRPCRFAIIGMGKLGGVELNYSSDIDLIFIYDNDGKTDGSKVLSSLEYHDRLAQEFLKLLTENTELGTVYRVDMRLRPHGQRGPLVNSYDAAMQYYDISARTWERQAFVKARHVAGDPELGKRFLDTLEPWVYRRYLNRADITGVKALKRKIEQRTHREGTNERDVKTGLGGIRDIEFVIQFLQLLNGGDLPEVRTGNTLQAIEHLAEVGCLTLQEQTILRDNYTYLRKLEHLLQIMLDVQTHTLPESDIEQSKLAVRMGYAATEEMSALEAFRHDYRQRTSRNRRVLDHLLHDAFADDDDATPESDLVLDPEPTEEFIVQTLEPYRFADLRAAHENLCALSVERIPFLSTRRCRHFLAAIAPELLKALGETPDPDAALVNLCQVSDSIGGKGVLWELFSFNLPTLKLYVRLCASSPYLSSILTSNPGMVDELMDSLMLGKLPDIDALRQTLQDTCRGAEDVEPIFHGFKNTEHLNVGVRDILGKEDIRETTAFLSDVAEVCVQQMADLQLEKMIERFGEPWLAGEDRSCGFVILGMGKFGGREPNYHSDLDVVFLYEADGTTRHRNPARTTSLQHFFGELSQRLTKQVNHLGPHGRLYEMDARLRPTGKSGPLAVSFDGFERYFTDGLGQLWERQALCRARPVYGPPEACRRAMQIAHRIIVSPPWKPEYASQIHEMRLRMEENASARNIKRSPGGIVDVEFLVQMLQMRFAKQSPRVLQPGTIEAIGQLQAAGHMNADLAEFLCRSYRFLRSIEAGLRLMNTTARHDLPEDEKELAKLAYLLALPSGDELVSQCIHYSRENRIRFNEQFRAASSARG